MALGVRGTHNTGRTIPARGRTLVAPKLEDRPAAQLAYIEHRGPFDKIPWPEHIERLYGWAKAKKVMPGFYPMAIYRDDPARTPPEDLRSEVGITFKGTAKGDGTVQTRKLPAMKVATVSHKGPGTEFAMTYAML